MGPIVLFINSNNETARKVLMNKIFCLTPMKQQQKITANMANQEILFFSDKIDLKTFLTLKQSPNGSLKVRK